MLLLLSMSIHIHSIFFLCYNRYRFTFRWLLCSTVEWLRRNKRIFKVPFFIESTVTSAAVQFQIEHLPGQRSIMRFNWVLFWLQRIFLDALKCSKFQWNSLIHWTMVFSILFILFFSWPYRNVADSYTHLHRFKYNRTHTHTSTGIPEHRQTLFMRYDHFPVDFQSTAHPLYQHQSLHALALLHSISI